MRVLMISGDPNLLKEGTGARSRLMLQRSVVDSLEVILWPKELLKPHTISGKFDMVTSQDPFRRGLAAWIAAKRLGARLNIQVHADLNAQSRTKHVLSQIVLRHADTVRAVSQKLKEQVARYTEAPISVLPVFIDKDRFLNLRSETPQGNRILWIGRFEEEKDPELALEVLKRARELGVEATMVMLGDGSMREKLQEKAKKLWVENYVEFPGWQEPLEYLKQADVVLCTSRAESFGASIVEALTAGVAVVAPDVGVAKEAGAIVAPKELLAEKTAQALREHAQGELRITLLSRDEWAAAWKESL